MCRWLASSFFHFVLQKPLESNYLKSLVWNNWFSYCLESSPMANRWKTASCPNCVQYKWRDWERERANEIERSRRLCSECLIWQKWQRVNIYWKYRWVHLIFSNWLFSNFQQINVSIKCCIFADVCNENIYKYLCLSSIVFSSLRHPISYSLSSKYLLHHKYIWNWLRC